MFIGIDQLINTLFDACMVLVLSQGESHLFSLEINPSPKMHLVEKAFPPPAPTPTAAHLLPPHNVRVLKDNTKRCSNKGGPYPSKSFFQSATCP